MEKKKRAVFIVAPTDFRHEELFETKEVLDQAGIDVTIASTIKGTITSSMNTTAISTMTLEDITVHDFDALVYIGGKGCTIYWTNALAHKLAIDALSLRKVLAAICSAPVTLANAGVLNGRRATCWKSDMSYLVARGAHYTGARVEYDDRIITGDGPTSSAQFGRSIVKELSVE